MTTETPAYCEWWPEGERRPCYAPGSVVLAASATPEEELAARLDAAPAVRTAYLVSVYQSGSLSRVSHLC